MTSSAPSVLAGVTEVAGHSAEVIVANPNGITCAGCGFLNVTRGTLATGTPIIGADGSLQNINVRNGTIDFEGKGRRSWLQHAWGIRGLPGDEVGLTYKVEV